MAGVIGSAQQNTMHGVLRRFHLFLFKQTQNLTRSMVVFRFNSPRAIPLVANIQEHLILREVGGGGRRLLRKAGTQLTLAPVYPCSRVKLIYGSFPQTPGQRSPPYLVLNLSPRTTTSSPSKGRSATVLPVTRREYNLSFLGEDWLGSHRPMYSCLHVDHCPKLKSAIPATAYRFAFWLC